MKIITLADWWWAGDDYLRVVRDKAIAQKESAGESIPDNEEWWQDDSCRKIKVLNEGTRQRYFESTGRDDLPERVLRRLSQQGIKTELSS